MASEREQENDYLKDMAPRLYGDDLRSKTRVPSGYFDTLYDRIAEKTEPFTPVSNLGDRDRWPWINYRNIAIAVALAVILGVRAWIDFHAVPDSPITDPIAEAAELFRTQSPQALAHFAHEIDERLLIQNVDPNILSTPQIPDGISDRELIEYLIYSGVSVEMIYSTQSDFIQPQNHKQ